ncbi:MAG: ADP-ribosylation factor-like protein, partial [Promethearchaeota archaeon]
RPKISLVGFSGVGKTTITKLIRAEEIPMEHIPTITGDIATVRIGKLHFHLWDFAGQEQFSYLWNNFIKGSDAVLLITDSTLENVEKSKFFLELIKEEAPNAHTAVIGNKQDVQGVIKPAQIERILGLKSYSMIAKDPENRNKMIQIIADILEMSAEVSPLLKPLLERDKLIEEATKALKSANFDKAAFLFDKISYLCIELGDDSLGKEFFEKSQKIKVMLEQVGVPQPTPAHPIQSDRTEQAKMMLKPEEVVKPTPSIPNLPLDVKELPTPKSPQSSPVPQQVSKTNITPEKVTNSIIENRNVGLKLNPEDFMVKIRPKRIGDVPKDAKAKLKTSAYGHVKNISTTSKSEIFTKAKPVEINVSEDSSKITSTTRPLELFKNGSKTPSQQPIASKLPVNLSDAVQSFTPTAKPITTSVESSAPTPKPITPATESIIPAVKPIEPIGSTQGSSVIDQNQVEHARKTLIELKLKKADLNKMAIDYDMKELTGEISTEELEQKKRKIIEYKKKIDDQIQELNKILKS